MNKRILCILDMDGTIYPKESRITFDIRDRIISRVATINNISKLKAKELYYGLSKNYPNPYIGLKTLNFFPDEYQNIFNSTDVEEYISADYLLQSLLQVIRIKCDIVFLSLAPMDYCKRLLNAIGIADCVDSVYSVCEKDGYKKEIKYRELFDRTKYYKAICIGDSNENDIVPAKNYGYECFRVDYTNNDSSIHSILCKVLRELSIFKSIPNVIRIENINSCNEQCIICPYSRMKRKKGVMSKELYESVIDQHSQLCEEPKLIFPASVGEPFLDQDFIDRISYASRKYNSISVFSNASVLDINLFKAFVDAGGTELMLTLHGYNSIGHARITQTSLYERVYQNIISVIDYNEKTTSPIRIFLDIYSDVDCDEFIATYASSNTIVVHNSLDRIHNWGGKIKAESTRELGIHCNRIYNQFGVQFDGTVVPCCVDIEGDYTYGNVSETPLNKIFESDNYLKILSMEKSGYIHMLDLCKGCNL